MVYKNSSKFLNLSRLIVLILAFNIGNSSYLQATEHYNFDEWVAHISQLAINKGISKETISSSFSEISMNKRVIELDQMQPEFTLTLNKYLSNATSQSRVKKGKNLYIEHKEILKKIRNKYGVQSRFILSLWGIETNFGKYTGSFKVIQSLATLSHNLRRRQFFTDELMNALQIIDEGHITPDEMMGSWAGAMGQNQFMPSSFLNYATDFDNDGKKDIWSTLDDVFASSSNYLKSSGWNPSETWGREVIVTNTIDESLVTTSAKKINVKLHISEWSELGVKNVDKTSLPDVNISGYLVYPEGPLGRKYIVYENFKTLMKWNRSLFFGIAVGTLSDMIEYY